MSEILEHLTSEQGSLESSLTTKLATAAYQHLSFTFIPLSSHLVKATVTVNGNVVDIIKKHTISLFKDMYLEGFDGSVLPDSHIEATYGGQIKNSMKNYLFNHHVVDFLFHELAGNKIIVANYPRLTGAETTANQDIKFHFDISIADNGDLKEWRHFAFKSPKRKKYKDLDKQVISFIDSRPSSDKILSSVVETNDWVMFESELVDKNNRTLDASLKSTFWVRISHQDASEAFICQMIGKKINEQFYTTDLVLHPDDAIDNRSYKFLITIKTIIKGGILSLDIFKATYKLKSKQDIHNKLMEIFSYRNDISQRKAIIEEVFHLLLSKHRFEVPKHLVLRREELIMNMLSSQPDYNVYKTQRDFEEFVQLLAEKQLKEEIIIDQISQAENIQADVRDIINYLHLISNKRLREFVYFKPLINHIEDADMPINFGTLLHTVTREKTINHIIHMISK